MVPEEQFPEPTGATDYSRGTVTRSSKYVREKMSETKFMCKVHSFNNFIIAPSEISIVECTLL